MDEGHTIDVMEAERQFCDLIEANRGILFKIANTYSRNRADRDDLIQEMVLQMWRSFGRFDPSYKFSTWMYRVALNVAISAYRRESRRREIAAPLEERVFEIAEERDRGPIPQRLQRLQKFISELGELDRAVILLYLEEMSQREIADILGLSETNVSTKVGRIKEKLRQRFSQPEHSL